MTSPSPSSWQASLQPGLIRRLTRPLGRSGLISTQMGQRILDRATRLNQRLPLLDHQMQRWSKVVDLEAPPLPIVYVQPPSEAELNQATVPGVTPTPPESGVAPLPSLGSEPWPALLPATPAAVPSPSPVGLAGDQGLAIAGPAPTPTPAPDRSQPLSAPAPLGEQPQSLALPAQPSFPGPLGQSPSLTPANPILAGANIPPALPLPPGALVSAQTSPVDQAAFPGMPRPDRDAPEAGFPEPARLITASDPPGPAIASPALPPLTPSPLPGPGVIQRRLEPSAGADLGVLPLLSRLPDQAPGPSPQPLGPAILAEALPLAQTWPDYRQTAIPGAVPQLDGEPGVPLGLPRFVAGEDPPGPGTVPGFEAAEGNAIAPAALPPQPPSPLLWPGVIQRRLEPSVGGDLGALPLLSRLPDGAPGPAPQPLGPVNLAEALPLAQTWPDYRQTAIPGAVPQLDGEPGVPLGLPRFVAGEDPPGPGTVPGFEAAEGNAIAPAALPPQPPSPLLWPGVIQRRLEPSVGGDLGALPLLSRLPDGAPGPAPQTLGPANLPQALPLAQNWPDYHQAAIPGAAPRLDGEPGTPLVLPRFVTGEDPPVLGFEAPAGNAIASPALPPLILSPLPGPGVIQRRLEPSVGAVPIDSLPTALPPIAPGPLQGQGMVAGLENLALPPVTQPAPPLDRPRQGRSESLGFAPVARPTAQPNSRLSPDKPTKISLRKTRWSQTIAVPELPRSSDEPTPGGLEPLTAGVSPLAFLTPAPPTSGPQGGFQSQPPGITDPPAAALFPGLAGQPTTAPPPGVVPTRSPLPNPASPLPASLEVTRLPGAKSSGGIPPVARIIPPAQSPRVQVDIAWSAPSLPTLPLPLLAMVNAAAGQQRPNHPDAPLASPPTMTTPPQALPPPTTFRESESRAMSAVPVPWQAEAEPRPAATSNLDMEALLETVERRLIKRLIVESERRGKPKWP